MTMLVNLGMKMMILCEADIDAWRGRLVQVALLFCGFRIAILQPNEIFCSVGSSHWPRTPLGITE